MAHHPSQHENFGRRIPDGDNRERFVCNDCGLIHYDNPKIVVGAVVTYQDKFLLCRRAIHPRKGFWTLPAGFLEEHESTEDGARREAYEEATALIVIEQLLAVYNVPRISQVQLIYKAHLKEPVFSPGVESLEVALFSWDEIPWDELAFPSVVWGLNQFREIEGKGPFSPFTNPAGETVSR